MVSEKCKANHVKTYRDASEMRKFPQTASPRTISLSYWAIQARARLVLTMHNANGCSKLVFWWVQSLRK